MASVNNALVLVLRRKVLAVKKGLIWYSSKGIKTFLPLHFCISNTSTPKHLHTSYLLPPPADTFHALAILLIPKTPAKMKTMDKQWLWKKKKKRKVNMKKRAQGNNTQIYTPPLPFFGELIIGSSAPSRQSSVDPVPYNQQSNVKRAQMAARESVRRLFLCEWA